MIKEKIFHKKNPLGYTDFVYIYLSSYLSPKDRRIVRKHELAHIWLQHQARAAQIKEEHGEIDNYVANLAFDLEIAKYIYTDVDQKYIESSFLKNGIHKEHVADFPGCEYAEDFYRELLRGKKELQQLIDNLDFESHGDEELDQPIANIVQAAKEVAAEHDLEQDKISKLRKINQSIKKFKPPKPSLADILDRHLGRYKISRASGYKRPSRKESDFILKGRHNVLKAPNLNVYVDRSGSFDASKTAEATNQLRKALQKYRGRIDLDVFYFSDYLMFRDGEEGCGYSTNHQAVVDHMAGDMPSLAVVITDDDYNDLVVPDKLPRVLVVGIGCQSTQLAGQLDCEELIV